MSGERNGMRPALICSVCAVLWPVMCVPSPHPTRTLNGAGGGGGGGLAAGPRAPPIATGALALDGCRASCRALARLMVLRGGEASASANSGDTTGGLVADAGRVDASPQDADRREREPDSLEDERQDGQEKGQRCITDEGWRPQVPCIPSDVSIHVDHVRREIHVLDMLGRPVNPRTGRPRELPALPVLEIEVPDSVAPGQEFIYSIPGHGDVRLRAPRAKRGLEPALGTLRRHTMLTLAPPPAVGAVHSRYLRGVNTVTLSNGTEYPLGFPEDLVGGAEGGCGNGSLPAEVVYVPRQVRFMAPPAARRAPALAALAAAGQAAAEAQAKAHAACTPAEANEAYAELAAAKDALRAAQSSVGEYACGGDWVFDPERGHGLVLPTRSDGVWYMPKVNASEYAAALEGALQQDSQAAWQVYLHANGSMIAHRVGGRRGKWLANRFGHLVCSAPLRTRLVFGRYILPDVHLQMTVVSDNTGSLSSPPAPPPTPMHVWDVPCDPDCAPDGVPGQAASAPLRHGPGSDQEPRHVHGAGAEEERVRSRKRGRTEGGRESEDEADLLSKRVPGASGLAGAMLREEEEEEEDQGEEGEEEEEDEAVGLKLRARYGRWVSGDCISCCTLPPSRLALQWLPRNLRSEYRQYLNVSRAAEGGDHEARRLLREGYNVSLLVERISGSLKQERAFNGGRLRLRYPLHAREVRCSFCNGSWARTPWVLNTRLNESMIPSTLEWYSNRKLWAHCQEGLAAEVLLTLDTLPTSVLARDEDFFGGVALHHAAWYGHAGVVKTLLARGTPVSVRDDYNWTALHHACQQGHTSVVQELLAAGAPVDEAGGLSHKPLQREFRPLHWAAYMGHAPVVRLLLAHGAEVNSREGDGSTPLFLATRWAHVAAIQELLAGGACLTQRCKCGIDDSAELTAIELAERLSLLYRFPRMVPSPEEIAHDTPLEVFPGWEAFDHVRNLLRLSLALKTSNTSAGNASATIAS